MQQQASEHQLMIGDWQVDPMRTRIRTANRVRAVQPLSMDILIHLAERAGQVVTTAELLNEFWPGRYVGSDAVHRRIANLRRALDDNTTAPRYIETIRKRGYRLIAEVEWAGSPPRPATPSAEAANPQPADKLIKALGDQGDLQVEFELKNGQQTFARGTLSLSAASAMLSRASQTSRN